MVKRGEVSKLGKKALSLSDLQDSRAASLRREPLFGTLQEVINYRIYSWGEVQAARGSSGMGREPGRVVSMPIVAGPFRQDRRRLLLS